MARVRVRAAVVALPVEFTSTVWVLAATLRLSLEEVTQAITLAAEREMAALLNCTWSPSAPGSTTAFRACKTGFCGT